MSRSTLARFVTLGIVWGIPYLLIRVAVQEVSPAVVVFGRTAIGALVLLPIAARTGGLKLLKGHWPWVAVFALIELVLPFGALGIAEQKISSSLAGLIIAAVPVINGIIAHRMHLDRDWNLRRASGVAIGLLGVAGLVGLDFHAETWWSVAITFIAVIGYAFGPIVITKKLATLPSIAVISTSQAIAALIYLPILLWELSNGSWRQTESISAQAWLSVVALGVLCTALAFILLFRLVDEIGPSRITIVTYLNPVVAVILGVTLLDEPITLGMMVGFPLVLIGSVLATRRNAQT